jgi:hypothetical protein
MKTAAFTPAGPLWMWAAVIDPAKGISQLPVIDPAFKSERSFTDPTAPLGTLGTSFRLSRMAVRTFVSHGTAVAVGVGVPVGVSVAVALGVAVGGIGVRVGRGRGVSAGSSSGGGSHVGPPATPHGGGDVGQAGSAGSQPWAEAGVTLPSVRTTSMRLTASIAHRGHPAIFGTRVFISLTSLVPGPMCRPTTLRRAAGQDCGLLQDPDSGHSSS